ncbi:hypothetical protein ACLOJK_031119 [Asimina triloba]
MGNLQYKKQAKMRCKHEESLLDLPVTQEGELRIEPLAYHNSIQSIAEFQFGEPRISLRINALPAGSHTMPMQGMPTSQFTDPSISTRSNVLSASHPLTLYKPPAMEHGNSHFFSSRLEHVVGISHPNAYRYVDLVVDPRASNRNDHLPLQFGDLEPSRRSSHSLLPELLQHDSHGSAREHGNSRVFSRLDHDAVGISHPNAYKFVDQSMSPRASDSNDHQSVQLGGLELLGRSSHHSLLPEPEHDGNGFHHVAAYTPKPSYTRSIFEED